MAPSTTTRTARTRTSPARRSTASHTAPTVRPTPTPVFEVRTIEDGDGFEWVAYVVRALPLAVAVLGFVLGTLGDVVVGAVIAILALVVFGTNLYVGSSRRLLDRLGGRSVDRTKDARLINIVDGLCIANGLRHPKLRLLDDDAPNAVALGRSAQSSVVLLTTGLLSLLDRIELEGVVAHCLAHIKRGDVVHVRTATTALGTAVTLFPEVGA